MDNKQISYNERHRINILRGFEFENFVLEFLKYYKVGEIKRDYIFNELGNEKHKPEADYYLNDNVIVEIRCFSNKQIHYGNLRMLLERVYKDFPEGFMKDKVLLIIVGNVIDIERAISAIKRKSECIKVEIIDVRNLFYLIRNNDMLTEKLTSLLSFSTEDEEIIPPVFNNNNLGKMFDDKKVLVHKTNLNETYIEKLKSWVPMGRENFLEFEELCVKVLKKLLNDNLMIWDNQRNSSRNMHRFDLICKIKTESQHDFWNILKHHFETRYIIFEFKNYKEKITQKEIYTTEKYLYAKVLRSVAIIISPYGENENAEKAIRGTLRESGKLIISLTINDLINMLKLEDSENGRTSSDYLSVKLDDLLIDLEK